MRDVSSKRWARRSPSEQKKLHRTANPAGETQQPLARPQSERVGSSENVAMHSAVGTCLTICVKQALSLSEDLRGSEI